MEANPYGQVMGQGMGQGMRQGQGMGPGQMQGMGHMGQVQNANLQVPQMGQGGMGQGMVGGGVGPVGVPGGMPMGPGMGMGDYPLEEALGPFPCVRLRGLPFEATVDDVLRFFQGLVPLDVVMVVRPDGRGAGEAIVVLPNHMELQMALSRDKQHMGRRYIEIFQAKRIDYYTAIMGQMGQIQSQSLGNMNMARGGPSGPMGPGGVAPNGMGGGVGGMGPDGLVNAMPVHTGVLRMRGLPFSATKQDVINFFQGLSPMEDTIQFVVRSDGRVTGEAFVSMATPQDAEAAMQRNGNHMGSRYVELFPSTPEEASRHTARHV